LPSIEKTSIAQFPVYTDKDGEMNERIRELAEQAELNLELQSLKVAKFAELILRECMFLVSEPGSDMNDTERGILAQIKNHFGIEE
jgi:hypothetical protein